MPDQAQPQQLKPVVKNGCPDCPPLVVPRRGYTPARPSCIECCEKHLGAAIVLLAELNDARRRGHSPSGLLPPPPRHRPPIRSRGRVPGVAGPPRRHPRRPQGVPGRRDDARFRRYRNPCKRRPQRRIVVPSKLNGRVSPRPAFLGLVSPRTRPFLFSGQVRPALSRHHARMDVSAAARRIFDTSMKNLSNHGWFPGGFEGPSAKEDGHEQAST